MVIGTLALEGAIQLVTAASFLFVGATLRGRLPATGSARMAARAFIGWWWGMGAYVALMALQSLAAAFDAASFPLFLALRIVGVPLVAIAAWGILTYVLFLLTGAPAVGFYAGVYSCFLAAAFWAETALNLDGGLTLGTWTASLAPVNPRLLTLVYALFAVPLVLSTVAYGALAARVRDPRMRYRIVLVSGSLLAWIVGGYAGAASGDGLASFVAISGFGLLAAGALLLAYRPPRAIVAWLDRRAEAEESRQLRRDWRRRRLATA